MPLTVCVMTPAKFRRTGIGASNISVPRLLAAEEIDVASKNVTNRYDPWYAKVAFGLFLCSLSSLVGLLVALYSGVPVVQFMTAHWLTQ